MLNIDERSSIHFSLKLPFSVFQSGGFYSAEDADSLPTHESKEKKEGAFCVWTYDDIYAVLTDDVKNGVKSADVFSFHYDVRKQGNVDPYQVALLIFNFSSNPSKYSLLLKLVSSSFSIITTDCHVHSHLRSNCSRNVYRCLQSVLVRTLLSF